MSAVILAISSAAAVFTACDKTDAIDIPVETVIGTQGEILGVSYYTVENESETQTVLYEITTKKPKKTKADDNNSVSEENTAEHNGDENSDSTKSADNSEKDTKKNTANSAEVKTNTPEHEIQQSTAKSQERTSASSSKNNSQTKHVPIPYVKPTDKPTEKAVTTAKRTQAQTAAAADNSSDETVPEKSSGVNVVFKSDTVEKGTTASIMIQGDPGKKYIIEFYETSSNVADYSDLAEQTADENGFVTWSFRVPTNCESGNKKIIVKEKGSSNFVQTSIKVK